MAQRIAVHTCYDSIWLYISQNSACQYVCSVTGNTKGHCMSLFRRDDGGKGGKVKGKGKVPPCTGTEALYRPYGP